MPGPTPCPFKRLRMRVLRLRARRVLACRSCPMVFGSVAQVVRAHA